MSDVSVVGLGAMGSALARALMRAGHRVTVWNRTASKAEALVREGAAPSAHLGPPRYCSLGWCWPPARAPGSRGPPASAATSSSNCSISPC